MFEPVSKLLRALPPSSIALTELRPVPTMCYKCYFCSADGPFELSLLPIAPLRGYCGLSTLDILSLNDVLRVAR